MGKYVQFKRLAKKRRVFSAFNAFPTPSGDKHVGHVRGDVLTDIIARWEQLNGAEIFYPTGIHATGRDVPTILEKILSPQTAEHYSLSLDVSYEILGLGDHQVQLDILKETFSDISHLEKITTPLINDPTLQQLYGQSTILREDYLTILRCIDTLLNDKDKKIKDVWEKEKRKTFASLYRTVEGTTQRAFLLNYFRTYYNISDQEANTIATTADDAKRSFRLLDLFKERYFATLRSLNIASTEDAFFTTADSAFHRFTQWAMRKLKEQNLIYAGRKPGPWCNECGEAKEIESSEASVRIDQGSAGDERVEEYSLIKFRDQLNRIVLIATKKPETVFEATNLWIHPKGNYVAVRHHRNKHPEQQDTTIISENCLDALVGYYHLTVLEKKQLSYDELTSLHLTNPITNENDIRLLPANFVDIEQGTGIVMSVPILDPHDYRYHHDTHVGIPLEGRVLIASKKRGTKKEESLSVDDHLGYRNIVGLENLTGALKEQILSATPKQLEILKTVMYRDQNAGNMVAGNYKNMSVAAARKRLKQDLVRTENGNEIHYLEGIHAFCRTHPETRIVLARVKEPSVKLGNEEWQDKTVELIKKHLNTTPQYLKEDLIADEADKGIIRTRVDKSCRRNAHQHIGTPIPSNIITTEKPSHFEALADSNVYMEYYKIAQFLSRGLINEKQLTDDFFNYLFLDAGNRKELAQSLGVSVNKIKQMKREIDATYPVGLNTAGTEHESVHIPYFLFYHAAILPEHLFPREVMMHGLVTRRKTDETGKPIGKAAKMGKSKGNAIPLHDALEHAIHYFYNEQDKENQNIKDTVSARPVRPSWKLVDPVKNERKWFAIDDLFPDERAGVDLLRYFTARGNKIADDFEWDDIIRDGLYKRGKDVIKHLTQEVLTLSSHNESVMEETELDQWLLSKLHGAIITYKQLMDERRLRKATIIASDIMTKYYGEYKKRKDDNKEVLNIDVLKAYLEVQLKFLYPIMPTAMTTLYNRLTHEDAIGLIVCADKSHIKLDLEFRLDYPTDQDKKALFDGIKNTLLPYISYAGNVDRVGLLDKEQENIIKIYLPSTAEANFLRQQTIIKDKSGNQTTIVSFEYLQQFLRKPLTYVISEKPEKRKEYNVRFELAVDPTAAKPYIQVNDKYTVDFASNIRPKPNQNQLTTSGSLSPV